MINIKSLSKSYRKNTVLNQINVQFEKGQVYGIVGENGAGKTTFFKCLVGLEKSKGSIDYHTILKDVCGFLPTNPYFFSKITGSEYLRLLCNGRSINIENFEAQNIFELPLQQYADTYSTGMKKKLALTGILLQNNEIFVLDEPFNGVDIQSNIMIKEIILRLKANNKTVLVSSHIFSTLNEVCDVLHHLKDGTIINSVDKDGFHLIEDNMKDSLVNKKLDNLISFQR